MCVFIELIFSAKVLKVMQFLPNGLNFSEVGDGYTGKCSYQQKNGDAQTSVKGMKGQED